jgi:ABC-type transport system involved in multi-copper enzyme maturation permease subunit
MMIWHIFKKDWTLLWRYAAGLAALHFSLMVALLRLGRFQAPPLFDRFGFRGLAVSGDHTFYNLTTLFPGLSALVSAFLIIAIVQQDAIPGVRQDWLVRPIRRRDLLLAKFMGVLLMVLAPILAADLSGGLFNGFPMGQALTSALGRSIWLWFSMFLAVFVLASLTRNLMEAIVGSTVVAGGAFVWGMLRSSVPDFLNLDRINWIGELIHLSIILAGAAVVLCLQYYFRKTLPARALTAAIVLLLLLVPGIPWQKAFAVEQRLSPVSGSANAVRLSFVPDHDVLGDRPVGPVQYGSRSDAFILLPVRVTVSQDEAVVIGETSKVRLMLADGQTQDLRPQMGFQVMNEAPAEGEKLISYIIRIPHSLYTRIADQSIRVEIDYYLTLLSLVDKQTLPATGGDERTRRLGWCGTKISDTGGEILLGCIQAGRPPTCASFVLEHIPSGARNPRNAICRPDYSPFRTNYGPDALSRFTKTLPFGDPAGIDTYPVKEPMLPESQVIARVYEAKDHFVRQLAIPQIRLREWVASE